MELNWAERIMVHSPVRAYVQDRIVEWMKVNGPLAEGANILEVGCGQGHGAAVLFEKFRPARVHACDLDIRMARVTAARTPERRRSALTLTVADMEYLPYRDGAFDALFCFGVLHHAIDWRRALAETARVLRKGGLFFFEEYYPEAYLAFPVRYILKHPTENRFSSGDLPPAMEEAGLSVLRAGEIKRLAIIGVAEKV